MIVRMLDGFCCDNRNGLLVGARYPACAER